MAAHLRFYHAPVHGAHVLYGIPRIGAVEYPDLYLE
jgi:hypothetical protein